VLYCCTAHRSPYQIHPGGDTAWCLTAPDTGFVPNPITGLYPSQAMLVGVLFEQRCQDMPSGLN
jgi:hypothetical protein